MSNAEYPSVTIVAGEIRDAGPGTFGNLLRMHGGATYITINPATAKQWVQTLTPIAESENNA